MNENQGEAVTKMNPEVKARWVAALRSGEYKQTLGKLKDARGHCCLGVLCDLYANEAGMARWRVRELSEQQDTVGLADEGKPGPQVVIWSGLDVHQAVLIGDARDYLFNHNDDSRTFSEIADTIEAQL